MECWAEHRVARGVSHVHIEKTGEYSIVASFRNYKGHLHRRNIELRDGVLRVEDSTDDVNVEVVQHFHYAYESTPAIIPGVTCKLVFDETPYSSEFGETAKATVAEVFGRGSACATIPLNDFDRSAC